MRYAPPLILLAGVFAYAGLGQGGASRLWLWPAVSFFLAGVAYGGLGPAAFGKRPDGTLPLWSLLLYLPYFGLQWSLWHLLRLLDPQACCSQLLPGVLIGRRPLAGELPEGVTLVVDLTAGFREPRGVRRGREYLSVPVLDSQTPDIAQLNRLLERLSRHRGTAYVHCAEGCGRAGLVAAALLLKRGLASTPDDAVRQVQACRWSVRLTGPQRRLLARWAAEQDSIRSRCAGGSERPIETGCG